MAQHKLMDWDVETNIQILTKEAVQLEYLISEYGENRSLGNVLQNVKDRLGWWLRYHDTLINDNNDVANPEPLDMKDM